MKASDLREFTNSELLDKKRGFAGELLNLRHQKIIGKIENPNRIREIKKTIARINTIIRERELQIR